MTHNETFTWKGRQFPVKKTAAPAKIIDGVKFECYRIGLGRCEWRSEDGRITFRSNYNLSGHNFSVDGKAIIGANGKRAKDFRSIEAGVRAALNTMAAK